MKLENTTKEAIQTVPEEKILAEIYQKNLEKTNLEQIKKKANVEKEELPGLSLVLLTQLIDECDLEDFLNGLEEYKDLKEEFIRLVCRISEKYETENHFQGVEG